MKNDARNEIFNLMMAVRGGINSRHFDWPLLVKRSRMTSELEERRGEKLLQRLSFFSLELELFRDKRIDGRVTVNGPGVRREHTKLTLSSPRV